MHPCEHARVHAPNLLPRARDAPHDLLALPPHVGSGARAIFPERDRAPARAFVGRRSARKLRGRRSATARRAACSTAPGRARVPLPPRLRMGGAGLYSREAKPKGGARTCARARARAAHGLSCALCALEHWAPEAAAGGRDPPAARPLDGGKNLYAMRAHDHAVALCARRPGFPGGFPDHRHGAHCGFACAR